MISYEKSQSERLMTGGRIAHIAGDRDSTTGVCSFPLSRGFLPFGTQWEVNCELGMHLTTECKSVSQFLKINYCGASCL